MSPVRADPGDVKVRSGARSPRPKRPYTAPVSSDGYLAIPLEAERASGTNRSKDSGCVRQKSSSVAGRCTCCHSSCSSASASSGAQDHGELRLSRDAQRREQPVCRLSPNTGTQSFNQWETPASAMSRRINERFARIRSSRPSPTRPALRRADQWSPPARPVRPASSPHPMATPCCASCLRWGDPNTSYQLAQATIDGYLQYVIDTVPARARRRSDFYKDLR